MQKSLKVLSTIFTMRSKQLFILNDQSPSDPPQTSRVVSLSAEVCLMSYRDKNLLILWDLAIF